MLKRILLPLILLAAILAGCGGPTPQPPAGEPTVTLPPEATATQPEPTPGSPAAPQSAAPQGCTVVSPIPTPGPTEQPFYPPITDEDWSKGPAEAPVTLIEYTDFQCPECAQLLPILEQILQDYPQDVRLVFRHLPLIGTEDQPFHDKAALAAQAAEAAGAQGKFWEMRDLLFSRQGEWISQSPEAFTGWVTGQAVGIGLDQERFAADLADSANVAKVKAAWDWALSVNLLYTPALLVNGQRWSTSMPLDKATIESVIRLQLLAEKQFTTCPPMAIDPQKQYLATIHTEKGDIVIQLFAAKAPLAVNNFVFLARNHWYDGVTFHRVLPDFVAQSGDPSGTGWGGPGYAFLNEVSLDLKFDKAGMVGMANSGADSNGSQFFITYGPTPKLDGKYTIFGRVVEGMDVVEQLTPRDPSQSQDLPPGDKISSIDILEQ